MPSLAACALATTATHAASSVPRRALDFRIADPSVPANQVSEDSAMAKTATVKIKLVSSADTGYYYVTKKNSRTKTDKLVMKKYDPIARTHIEFKESKIK